MSKGTAVFMSKYMFLMHVVLSATIIATTPSALLRASRCTDGELPSLDVQNVAVFREVLSATLALIQGRFSAVIGDHRYCHHHRHYRPLMQKKVCYVPRDPIGHYRAVKQQWTRFIELALSAADPCSGTMVLDSSSSSTASCSSNIV